MKDNTNEKLFYICNYAMKNLKFYKKLYKDINIKTIDEFKKLPLIKKEMVQNAKKEIISEEYSFLPYRDNLFMKRTSGSTGQCLKIFWDKYDNVRSLLELWYVRSKYYNIYPSNKCCFFFTENNNAYDITQNIEKDYYEKTNIIAINKRILMYEKLDIIFYLIEKNKVEWMILQPSDAIIIAEYLVRNNLTSKINIKYIELTGEYLTKENRQYIESVFKCKVNNQYGANEFNSIACEHNDNKLHINTNNVYVEILDDNGNELFDKKGKIYVTSLLNKAMPLIRYEIGDIGKICINEKDDYILELLSGRKLNYILLENGEKISPYIFPKIIEQINDELGEIIIQFQIIQLNIRDFLIYFVLNPQMSNWSIAVKNKFVNYMNFTKFKNVNWEIKFLKNIYPDFNTGKLSFFINKLIGE